MKSVCSYGSSSLLFMMKVMVGHFVSDSHKVTTTLIVMLSSSVVQISLQSHRYVPVMLLSVEYLIDTYMQALLSNCLVKMS